MPLYTVPSTAVYRDAITGDARSFVQNDVIDMTDAVRFAMPGATSVAAVGSSVNAQAAVRAVTATTDGLGDGTIPLGTDFVTVTSANANNIVVLPNAAVGTVIRLRNGATGYELRSHDPATNAINGGTGAAAESAIAANTLVTVVRATSTTWIGTQSSTAGVVAVTEVAAP